MRKKHMALAGALFILATTVLATPLEARKRGNRHDFKREMFEKLVFSPELVMRHQAEIGLTEDQKQALVAELQRTQTDLVPVQLEIAQAGEELVRLLETAPVDEAAALAEAERVMNLETAVKMHHLSLVIRIKNMLSSEQQAQLREIRDRSGSSRREDSR